MLNKEPLPTWSRALLGCVGVLGVIGAGELAIRSGLVSGIGTPLPSSVIAEAFTLVQAEEFRSQVLYTLTEWLTGLAIATVAGVVLGGLMGAFGFASQLMSLTVEILRPLPSIAIGPLLVLVLGSGMLPLSLTVAVACVWPVLFNTVYGVRAVDRVAVDTARTLKLSGLETAWRIRLPNCLPFVFTGVRVAGSIGLIVAVSAEVLIGNGAGIGGYILLNSTSATNLDAVYAATLVAGVLGVIVNALLGGVDRVAFGWKKGLAQ